MSPKAVAHTTKTKRIKAQLVDADGVTDFTSPQFFRSEEAAVKHGQKYVAGALKVQSLHGKIAKLTKERDGFKATLRETGANLGKANATIEAKDKTIAKLKSDISTVGKSWSERLTGAVASERKHRENEKDVLRLWMWFFVATTAVAVVAVFDLKYGFLPW